MSHPEYQRFFLVLLFALLACGAVIAGEVGGTTAAGVVSTPPGDATAGGGGQDLLTGRAFLPSGAVEGAGYGRYSYLLFAERPNAGNRKFYVNLLEAYLHLLEQASRLEGQGVQRQELNLVLLPVSAAPPDAPTVEWLLEHLDHARAGAIQAMLGKRNAAPAYMVSHGTPLSGVTNVEAAQVSVDDLSEGNWKGTFPDQVRSGARLTGRAFLATGVKESEGYGLYSYVLFVQPVNAGNRALYAAVLDAYLDIREIGRFEAAGAERRDLNVTYLPIRMSPPKAPTPAWLLEQYDFVRAQIILRAMDKLASGGPYIFSYSAPLTSAAAIDPRRLLVQDLSAVPADLAFLWVNEFIAQARQPQYWDPPALRRFMLSLRTNIAVMARAFVEVRSAHANVTSFVEGKIQLQE